MRIKWNHLVMVIVLSALAFGGTFTCESGDDDDPPTTPVNPAP